MPHFSRRRRRRKAVLGAAAATAIAAAASPAIANAAVTATYTPGSQALIVIGDSAANEIVVSRDAGGKLLVNDGAVAVLGGTPTVANVATVQLFGLGDDDVLRLNQRNGALPRANLFGGLGKDFLVGGSGVDQLFGQDGDDTVDGKGGDDYLFPSAGNDSALWTVTSGSDLLFGAAGHDRVRMTGTAANDDFRTSTDGTVATLGHNRSGSVVRADGVEEAILAAAGGEDDIALGSLAGTATRKVAIDLGANFNDASPDAAKDRIAITGSETLAEQFTIAGHGAPAAQVGTTVTVRKGEPARDTVKVETKAGGNDIVDASALPADSAALTVRTGDGGDLVSGGAGDDQIDAGIGDDDVRSGGGKDNVVAEAGNDKIDAGAGDDLVDARSGDDQIDAGDGVDTVFGGLGSDVARLGPGNDRFMKSGGQGSDTVEGEDGFDRVEHAGTGGSEKLEVSRDGERVKLSRDISAEVTDMDGVERIFSGSSFGNDSLTVNAMAGSGTALREVDVDLAGDSQEDRVRVFGTTASDKAIVSGNAARTLVTGLHTTVRTTNSDAGDVLTVQTLVGNDTVDASTLDPGGARLTIAADGGADTVDGSRGPDILLGGTGTDTVRGGPGSDTAILGNHDDAFAWQPGDGSDTVLGGDGADRLKFTGSPANEAIDLLANGSHLRLARDVASVDMDVDEVEHVDLSTLGGADRVAIGDLAGTDITAVDTAVGAADGAADDVRVDGTLGPDAIALTGRDGVVTVGGLPATTSITDAGEEDDVEIRGLAGTDTFDTSALGPIVFGLSLKS